MDNKKIYFISDAHLDLTRSVRENRLCRFLYEIGDSASHLYILGDLFDFWLEYKNAIPAGYLKVLSALLSLTERGIAITFLPGNHDFWIGDFLQNQAGIKLAGDSLDIEHFDKRIHLYHGDGLAYGDNGYRFIKRMFRFKPFIWLYKLLPVDLAYAIANRSSHASREYTSKKPKDVQGYYDYAKQRLQSGRDAVIMGHTHIPEIKEMADGLYINSGDWINNCSYVVLDEDGFRLKFYESGD